jgi:hypothetical protein
MPTSSLMSAAQCTTVCTSRCSSCLSAKLMPKPTAVMSPATARTLLRTGLPLSKCISGDELIILSSLL